MKVKIIPAKPVIDFPARCAWRHIAASVHNRKFSITAWNFNSNISANI